MDWRCTFILLDTKKIRKLGWKTKYSIKKSIIHTLQYLKMKNNYFYKKTIIITGASQALEMQSPIFFTQRGLTLFFVLVIKKTYFFCKKI